MTLMQLVAPIQNIEMASCLHMLRVVELGGMISTTRHSRPKHKGHVHNAVLAVDTSQPDTDRPNVL